jgi:hypothetical protein
LIATLPPGAHHTGSSDDLSGCSLQVQVFKFQYADH